MRLRDSPVKTPPELKQMFGANIQNFEPRIANLREPARSGRFQEWQSGPVLYLLDGIFSSSSRKLQRLFRISESMPLAGRGKLIPRRGRFLSRPSSRVYY